MKFEDHQEKKNRDSI